MDFARTQLEKYGWKEGEGLGKKKDGQAAPIRTKMKLNSHGIGYNPGVEYSNNWWERVFNEAASNLQSVKDQNGSVTQLEANGSVKITTEKKRKGRDLTYGNFKKKSCLNVEETEEIPVSDTSSEDDAVDAISDDRLFEICGRRTGHKGARHGLTLSGKLARLERQEQQLSSKPPKPTRSSDAPARSASDESKGLEAPETDWKKNKKKLRKADQ